MEAEGEGGGMKDTTDLALIKEGNPFCWGKSIHLYEVGEYAILSFYRWKTDGCTVLSGQPDKNKIDFHVWINGHDTSHSFDTLDEALVGAVALKHEGPNGKAHIYFKKMIKEAKP
jgi:hypothetical protein